MYSPEPIKYVYKSAKVNGGILEKSLLQLWIFSGRGIVPFSVDSLLAITSVGSSSSSSILCNLFHVPLLLAPLVQLYVYRVLGQSPVSLSLLNNLLAMERSSYRSPFSSRFVSISIPPGLVFALYLVPVLHA